MEKLQLGISPCPNDTFMFDALINERIDTEGLQFDLIMEDVEELNNRAFRRQTDVSKVSYHAYAYLMKDYVLLDSGGALGSNCGPLVITKGEPQQPIEEMEIAIPGKYTTANFLFSLAYPGATQKKEMLFSDIENAVLNEEVGAGVIIHENRFTYKEKGLHKVLDLGEYWEKETQSPIPLGGIIVKRSLSEEVQRKINRVVRKSVEYALQNPFESQDFIKEHAQEMDHHVIYNHIDLYVNQFSVELGDEGRKAVQLLFQKAREEGIISNVEQPIFVNDKETSSQ